MNTATGDSTRGVPRRAFLQLAVASLLVISACSVFRSPSEVDRATAELKDLLDDIAANPAERSRLESIGGDIAAKSNELVDEHDEFIREFDRSLSDRSVSEQQLEAQVAGYDRSSTRLRNELLSLQQDLHDTLTPEQWAEVVEALNRTGSAASQRIMTVT